MSKVETVEVAAQPFVGLRMTTSGDPQAIGSAMAPGFVALLGHLAERELEMAGMPLAVYHDFSPDQTTFEVGLPINAADADRAGDGDIAVGETPGGRAVKALHIGPYAKLGETHGAIMTFMADRGLQPAGPSWEVYVDDPGDADESTLRTEIYYPIA